MDNLQDLLAGSKASFGLLRAGRLGAIRFYFLSLWERTEVRATEVDAPSPFPLPKGEGKEAHKVIEGVRCD